MTEGFCLYCSCTDDSDGDVTRQVSVQDGRDSTHSDGPYHHHGLAHGKGLVKVLLIPLKILALAWSFTETRPCCQFHRLVWLLQIVGTPQRVIQGQVVNSPRGATTQLIATPVSGFESPQAWSSRKRPHELISELDYSDG